MANVKITALTHLAGTDAEARDVFVIDDISATETKKISVANVIVATGNAHLVQANVTAEDAALQSRLSTNVTSLTNEDTALQARITANATTAASNDFITFTRLNANINVVQDNVASVTVGTAADTETRLNSNLNVVQDNVVAAEANVVLVRSNIDSFASTANTDIAAVEARRAANTTSDENSAPAVEARRVANIAGAVSSITTADLTASRAMVSDSSGKVSVDTQVTATELNHLNGVTSAIQPQISSIAADTGLNLSNLNAFATTTNSTIETLSSNLTANLVQIEANVNAVQSNLAARNVQLNANLDVVQDNVAAITDGTTNFTGEVTMNDDLIVTGNLTINGDQTVINTTNMEVDDTLIMLANGTTGAPANDIGILFNRGNQGNAAFYYDESAKTFKVSDTQDPSSNTTIHPVTASNLDVGRLTAATVEFDGADLSTAITDNVALLDTRSNAFDTFTKLDANIDVVSSNADAIEARRVANIAGAVSSVLTADLTASRAVETNGSGKLAASSVTSTELGKLSGLTASTTELNYVDITTLGTVEASKAVTADSSGEVLLPDDKAIKFGTGGDFTIKFDGSDAFLEGPSTGEVRITTNQFQVFNKAGTQTMFRVDAGSITNLYNAGSLKLQTKNDGIRIVGEMQSNDIASDGNVAFGTNTSNTVTSQGTISAPAFKFDGADLNTAITDNVALLDTRANAFATFTKLDANIDVVQDNVASIIDGTAGFTGDLTVETTDDGSAASPILNLKRNSASPADADYLGQIKFKGENDADQSVTYAKISGKINDATDGTEDGIIEFSVVKDGSNHIAVRVNNNGLFLNNGNDLKFEGTSADAHETTLTAGEPTGDRTITLPDSTGTVALTSQIDTVSDNSAAVESRRVANIAGAVSTITTSDLTASRALVSDGSGKVSVSSITSTELGFLDGLDQNLNANLVALAAGVAASQTGVFPTGDFGLLDAANAATDAFGLAVADLTIFDMRDTPAGQLETQDLGAFT
jgi:hypothetical protein